MGTQLSDFIKRKKGTVVDLTGFGTGLRPILCRSIKKVSEGSCGLDRFWNGITTEGRPVVALYVMLHNEGISGQAQGPAPSLF
ncbi:MAG: hypothetical protein D3904_09565 [Candidatus Electrothrix sp. EH2]|nr:hypothetical protein [Candidatus Electrothrix sp. EH2]